MPPRHLSGEVAQACPSWRPQGRRRTHYKDNCFFPNLHKCPYLHSPALVMYPRYPPSAQMCTYFIHFIKYSSDVMCVDLGQLGFPKCISASNTCSNGRQYILQVQTSWSPWRVCKSKGMHSQMFHVSIRTAGGGPLEPSKRTKTDGRTKQCWWPSPMEWLSFISDSCTNHFHDIVSFGDKFVKRWRKYSPQKKLHSSYKRMK